MQEYHEITRRAEEALKCTQNDLNGWIVVRKMCSWIKFSDGSIDIFIRNIQVQLVPLIAQLPTFFNNRAFLHKVLTLSAIKNSLCT